MIYWRRPFVKVKEEDEGLVRYAIVAYEKRAAMFKIVGLYKKPVRWRHYLRIDLWIAVLDFQWTTGRHLV